MINAEDDTAERVQQQQKVSVMYVLIWLVLYEEQTG